MPPRRSKTTSARSRNIRPKTTTIQNFILDNVEDHPRDLASRAASEFYISRQAINRHLGSLVARGILRQEGNTKSRSYKLAIRSDWTRTYQISESLAEHDVWDHDILPLLERLPKNVLDIWQFCFTEMCNNAVDHSAGTEIVVTVLATAITTEMRLSDDGVGIFRKIQQDLRLSDERQAVLQLSKGKLTTDPVRHSGQGIFFTSRLVDAFDILSGGVFFTQSFEDHWILQRTEPKTGTTVFLRLHNNSTRQDKEIFERYSSDDGVSFAKTVVPVRLARYGREQLVSRSQAKRLLAGVDRFETVLFDFSEVDSIGQAFADEIFRVFARSHPKIQLLPVQANEQIALMIAGAQADWTPRILSNRG